MTQTIRITIGDTVFPAELNDTRTARQIAAALPLEGQAHRWGDELYILTDLPGDAAEADRDVLEVGDLAYWPPGGALCIFWGPTPLSSGSEPRAAGPVAVIGRITGNLNALATTRNGDTMQLLPQ